MIFVAKFSVKVITGTSGQYGCIPRSATSSKDSAPIGRLALMALIAVVGLSLFPAERVFALGAENGEPWTHASGGGGDFPNVCGPTYSDVLCSNQEAVYACQVNTQNNPQEGPSTLWCGATTTSCTVYSSVAEFCTIQGPYGTGTTEVTAPAGEFFATTHAPGLANCGTCARTSTNSVSDPVSPSVGNVTESQTDVATGSSPNFQRFYNSLDTTITDLGVGWRHSFGRQIVADYSNTPFQAYTSSDPQNSSLYGDPAQACTIGWNTIKATSPQWATTTATYTGGSGNAYGICSLTRNGAVVATLNIYNAVQYSVVSGGTVLGYTAIRDDGQQINYWLNGSSIVTPVGISMHLSVTSGGYQLIDDQDATEMYNSAGRLISVTLRGGSTQTLTYDAMNRLNAVSDGFGHQLTFTYNAQNQLSQVSQQ